MKGLFVSLPRITSACAEKRPHVIDKSSTTWNYLRMRGEEPARPADAPAPRELPPHARRRDVGISYSAGLPGITSACAEKRDSSPTEPEPGRNYLRMRGEEVEWR